MFSSSDSSKKSDSSPTRTSSDIFAQTESISQFIKNHLKKKSNDGTFMMLQEFFGVFHDQLRINFDLRNELALRKKNNKVDFAQLSQRKGNIETFIQYFNKVRQCEHNDLREVAETIQEDVETLSSFHSLSEKVKKLHESMRSNKESIESKEGQLLMKKNSTNEQLFSINQKINEKIVKSNQLQNAISEIEPFLQTLRSRVEEKEEKKKELSQLLFERRTMIREVKRAHEEAQQKRRAVKDELRTKLGRLTAEYHQLIYQEQPLIKALEEAEKQLKIIKEKASEKINEISSETKATERKMHAISTKLNELVAKKELNESQIVELKRTIELQTRKHEFAITKMKLQRKELERLEDAIRKHIQNAEDENSELKFLSDTREDTAQYINQRTEEIENLRKDNQRIISLLRVTSDKIKNQEDNNIQLKTEKLNIEQEFQITKEKYTSTNTQSELYIRTMKAFENLRDGLGFMNFIDTFSVVNYALEIVHASRIKLEEDEIPMRVTTRMISDGIDRLAVSISKLDQKLND